MKTDQTMQLTIGTFSQQINHTTMMGNLSDIWSYGNSLRIAKGYKELDLGEWLSDSRTLEFIEALERKFNIAQADFIVIENSTGDTWAHLYLMLDAAASLDAGFKLDMYEALVKGNLLDCVEDSGGALIESIRWELLKGRRDMKVFNEVTALLKAKVNPDGGEWITATRAQLKLRTTLEQTLISFIETGCVRDLDHLKDTIRRI